MYFLPIWDDTFYYKNVNRIIEALKVEYKVVLILEDNSNLPKYDCDNVPGFINGNIVSYIKTIILLAIKRPKVIFTYKGYNINFVLSLYRMCFRNTKLVVKADSQGPAIITNRIKSICKFIIETFTFKILDLMIVESKGLKKSYISRGIQSSNISLYRNTFNINNFVAPFPKYYKKLKNIRYIFFPGRLSYLKGVDIAIQLFAKIAHNDIHIVFMGVDQGDGSIQTINKAVKNSPTLSGKVHIYKSCNNFSTLMALYKYAFITLITSRDEGLPNRATESLQNGTPVVSFDVGNISSLEELGGVSLFKFDDLISFGKYLDIIINNRQAYNKLKKTASSASKELRNQHSLRSLFTYYGIIR